MARLLMVDTGLSVHAPLVRAVRSAGFEVECVSNGRSALDATGSSTFDLIVLNLAIPGIDGFGICRELRRRGDSTPIIVISANRRTSDSVAVMDVGADDYIAAPIDVADLLARIRALLRRSGGSKGVQSLRFLDLELDPATLVAKRGHHRVELTRTEFALLHLFMRNPNRILSRSQILAEAWGHDFGDLSNSVEIYVGYLRRKLEAGGHTRILHTVRGSGYLLSESKP